MHIIISRLTDRNFLEQIQWCAEHFGPGLEVVSPIQAELHRWSYEIIGFGIKQIYFATDEDYTFFSLRWS